MAKKPYIPTQFRGIPETEIWLTELIYDNADVRDWLIELDLTATDHETRISKLESDFAILIQKLITAGVITWP